MLTREQRSDIEDLLAQMEGLLVTLKKRYGLANAPGPPERRTGNGNGNGNGNGDGTGDAEEHFKRSYAPPAPAQGRECAGSVPGRLSTTRLRRDRAAPQDRPAQ